MNQLRVALLMRRISLIPFIPAILHILEVMYAILIACVHIMYVFVYII